MSTVDIKIGFRARWWLKPYLVLCALFRVPARSSIVRRGIVWWVAALALLCGCPNPPAPPHPDASDASLLGDAPDGGICVALCTHLAQLPSEHGEPIGCPEGRDPKCVKACEVEFAAPITDDPVACWTSAPTKAAARACGAASTGHLACSDTAALWYLDASTASSASNWSLLYDGSACYAQTLPNHGGSWMCDDGGAHAMMTVRCATAETCWDEMRER